MVWMQSGIGPSTYATKHKTTLLHTLNVSTIISARTRLVADYEVIVDFY